VFGLNGIFLRVIEEKDIDPIRQLRNDPSTWMHLTDITLLSAKTQQRWYDSLSSRNDRKYFVLGDEEHEFLGIIRLDEIDQTNRSIRVGCDIVPAFRGQGFGTKAFQLIKKYCFDYLNMHRLWLAVLETNHVAIRLYEKHGFRVEGRYREAIFRDGKYLDYIIMSLLEREYRNG
jgi:UDP-4-amino-4,6-dideoxy-N-acetyl-beta-L-altrosamine N-acetyltransferase